MSSSSSPSRAFLVFKHSWKGKFKRVLLITDTHLSTLSPDSMKETNVWSHGDLVSATPTAGSMADFSLTFRKASNAKKNDALKFSSESHRAAILSIVLHHQRLHNPHHTNVTYQGFKYRWSEDRRPMLLELAPYALLCLDPATRGIRHMYEFRHVMKLHEVEDYPGGFIVQMATTGKSVLMASEMRKEIMDAIVDLAAKHIGCHVEKSVQHVKMNDFLVARLGKFSQDVHQTSLSEFTVFKIPQSSSSSSPSSSLNYAPKPTRRRLCLSETCLLERDPSTYSIVNLRPLSTISALVRHETNTQMFSVQYNNGQLRNYTSTSRDALLASLLDGVRGSGNRDVHVRMAPIEMDKRLGPLEVEVDEEVESMHLKFIISLPPTWKFNEAVARFNANISYSGLSHAVTQEHLFAENKEKLIHSALTALMRRDISDFDKWPVEDVEQHLHALRRLVASKAGFAAFTSLEGFRECVGSLVAKALKRGHDGVSHAAIDTICALMEPMHENYDLRQEQMNKLSLLSSQTFLNGLIDMWTNHVNRGTGALIVSAMLDFLTFALCSPYSETTDGKQFDMLLEQVADKGRTLYRLFQHPSHTIVKGAGLVMKAITEEASEDISKKMQLLALSQGALPIHLLTALYTKSDDERLLINCQLSRHLVGLWTAESEVAEDLLRRIFPSGLLQYLYSDESVSKDVDRLHVRDNLKLAVTDAESNKGNAVLRAAGKGLRQAKQVASKTAETVAEKTSVYTEETLRQVDSAMQHWRTKMGSDWQFRLMGDFTKAQEKQGKENNNKPIVLRRRRQRVKSKENWPLFYSMFPKDHARPNLIWNLKTRQELRETLENEIAHFSKMCELSSGTLISWNYAEFEVQYASLVDEIKIGDYFLRILLEHDENKKNIEDSKKKNGGTKTEKDEIIKNDSIEDSTNNSNNEDDESLLHKSKDFFNDLYHRFLLTPKTEMKAMCLQALAIVYGRHLEEIGVFNDTKYIVAMLEKTHDFAERDRLLQFLGQLVKHKANARAFCHCNGVKTLVDLLPLAHLHVSRAILNTVSTAIEASSESSRDSEEKEWFYGSLKNERNGPVSFSELKDQFEQGHINAKTKVWAQGMEGWRLLSQVPQLKWTLLAKGTPLLNESQMATLILDLLINICRYFPSKDIDGAIVRPVPKVKAALSSQSMLPHVVQLLLTFEPSVVERVSTLLQLVLEDNPKLATLYLTGAFFFVLMYNGSNLLPIARFLEMAHTKQAFRSEEKSNSSSNSLFTKSILSHILPEAMVAYLDNYGPTKFSELYLGHFDTPEAIWSTEMRQLMIQKLAYHLADFTPRLKSNVKAIYQYCPIPLISYPVLESELFCDNYYLRNLCDTFKFPDWPVKEPIKLLREVLQAWRSEVAKKPSSMNNRDALAMLNLTVDVLEEEDEVCSKKIRQSYYRMSQKYHPDKNPDGREMFEKVNNAYEFLCARSAKRNDQPDPGNIVLILRTQSILFSRYPEVLHPYKYAGYPMLIKTIQLETADEKLFSKSAPLLAAASECAYYTVKCSALNAEEMRRENGLEVLYEAFERCVSVLSQSSKADDVAVQVCMHIIRFYAVAAEFAACRERMAEMTELVRNICRVFYFKQLMSLCSVAAECVASLAIDAILQMHLLQAGSLWHLLLFLFDYDYTLEESGVNVNEESSPQALANRLAKLSLFACARLAGLLEEEGLQTPKNPVIEDCLTAMVTPHIVDRTRNNEVEEALKLLNSNSGNPYLVWDNGTRAELIDVLESERTSCVRRGICDPAFGANFKFSAHDDELIVGNVFVRIFNQQPTFQLEEPKRFAVDLLQFLNDQVQYLSSLSSLNETDKGNSKESERTHTKTKLSKLKQAEMAMEALSHVVKNNQGVEIQCIGHFKLLFYLLKLDQHAKLQEQTLHVLSSVTRTAECVDDIVACNILAALLLAVYDVNEKVALALGVLDSLSSDTRIVKEGLAKGAVVCLTYHFCCSSEESVRRICSESLAKMSSDKLLGPKVRLELCKILPEIFLDAMRRNPEVAMQMFESAQENPELIWNDETRRNVKQVITTIANKHKHHLETRGEEPFAPDANDLMALRTTEELVVAGIYIRLFLSNPGWVLRNPKDFLVELLESALQQMQSDNQQRLDQITEAFVKLLLTQPALADVVPSTGYISRLAQEMKSFDDNALRHCMVVVNELARSSACVDSMATIVCVPQFKKAFKARSDGIKVACELFSRIFAGHHDALVRQALDCRLVHDLLDSLDSSTVDYECRALIVKALKDMKCSLGHGEEVSAVLSKSDVWKDFDKQRHDLFLQNESSVGYLTSTASTGVAGYLTNASEDRAVPSVPPPIDEPPIASNNPLL